MSKTLYEKERYDNLQFRLSLIPGLKVYVATTGSIYVENGAGKKVRISDHEPNRGAPRNHDYEEIYTNDPSGKLLNSNAEVIELVLKYYNINPSGKLAKYLQVETQRRAKSAKEADKLKRHMDKLTQMHDKKISDLVPFVSKNMLFLEFIYENAKSYGLENSKPDKRRKRTRTYFEKQVSESFSKKLSLSEYKEVKQKIEGMGAVKYAEGGTVEAYQPWAKVFEQNQGVSYETAKKQFEEILNQTPSNDYERALRKLDVEYRKKNDTFTFEADFVSAFLEDDFPKKAAGANKKLRAELSGEIHIKPLKYTTTNFKSKLDSLRNIVGTDEVVRPAMSGVYYDSSNNSMVATNAHILVSLPEKNIKRNKIVNIKDQSEIKEKYPNYQAVIPHDNPSHVIISDVQTFMDSLTGLARAESFVEKTVMARFVYDGDELYFSPSLLKDLMDCLIYNGIKKFRFELSAPNRGVMVRDADNKNQAFGLVMPFVNPGAFTNVFEGNTTDGTKRRQIVQLEKKLSQLSATKSFDERFAEEYLADAKKAKKQKDIDYYTLQVATAKEKKMAEAEDIKKRISQLETEIARSGDKKKESGNTTKIDFPRDFDFSVDKIWPLDPAEDLDKLWYKQGYRFYAKVSIFESMGERGENREFIYSSRPTNTDISRDVIQAYRDIVSEGEYENGSAYEEEMHKKAVEILAFAEEIGFTSLTLAKAIRQLKIALKIKKYAQGGVIINDEVKGAINDILKFGESGMNYNYKFNKKNKSYLPGDDITNEQALVLYKIFADKDMNLVSEIEFLEGAPEPLKVPVVDKKTDEILDALMDEEDYVRYDEGYIIVLPQGRRFIEAVRERVETRELLNQGQDLFPSTANVPDKIFSIDSRLLLHEILWIEIEKLQLVKK